MEGLEIKIFDSKEDLYVSASGLVAEAISELVSIKKDVSIAMAGGTTPRSLYESISGKINDWSKVHIFWGDERCVPPDNEQSNFRTVEISLLSRISIRPENVHRIKGELGPEKGAREYEDELRAFFPNSSFPEFDLIFLGLGEDAHTASLFPHSDILKEDMKWVAGVRMDNGPDRITLSVPSINHANQILFLVTGAGKADAVDSVFYSTFDPEKHPAQAVNPRSGNIFWLMDRDAASAYLKRSAKP